MKKLFLISAMLVILDQITKWYFSHKTIPITSYFSLTYAENTGAAFGILQGMNIFFIIISIIVILGILYYYKTYPLALTVLLAGTIGNLIDRIFFGFVRDFISISIWPIFNLADSYNTIAIALLIWHLYKEEREDKLYKRSQLEEQ